jgi:hypothetical protein
MCDVDTIRVLCAVCVLGFALYAQLRVRVFGCAAHLDGTRRVPVHDVQLFVLVFDRAARLDGVFCTFDGCMVCAVHLMV